MLVVEGVWLDGSDTPVGRDLAPRGPNERIASGRQHVELDSIPFQFDQTGNRRVRIAVWHIYGPEDLHGQLLPVDDAGRPIFPDAVVASHRFEIEHEIRVTD